MMSVKLLVIGVLFVSCASGYMDLETFKNKILQSCYEERDHLTDAQPHSFENFLYLLEKFEVAKPEVEMKDVLDMFLNRFVIEGVIKQGFYKIDPIYKSAMKILHAVVNDKDPPNEFPEDVFTEDEKCALHFMLSYTVNDTFRDGVDNAAYKMPPRINAMLRSTGSPMFFPRAPTVSRGREQGLVSLHSHPIHAFALGRVLPGIYLGVSSMPIRKVNDVIKILSYKPMDVSDNAEIEPLYAFTIADILTFPRINEQLSNSLGPNGKWIEQYCPDEYQMTEPKRFVSYSVLRGAIDGLVLGSNILTITEEHPNIKLSEILRMYYSHEGIRPSKLMNSLSYCNRQAFIENDQKIEEQVTNYAMVYSKVDDIINEKPISFATETMAELKNSYDDLFLNSRGSDGICQESTPEDGEFKCETPSDVIFVLDLEENQNAENNQKQLDTVKKIVSDMDLTMGRSTVSVLTRNSNNVAFGLEALANRSTSVAKTLCVLQNLNNRTNGAKQDEQIVIKRLNHMIKGIKDAYGVTGGIPGQVVVYFNYENNGNPGKELTSALKDFHSQHKDVRLYAVGDSDNEEVLKAYVKDKGRDFLTEPNTDQLVKDLKQKICEAPAILKYNECKSKKDVTNNQNIYKGSVLPKHIQYFYMYPDYFYSSTDMKIVFETTAGNIRVCRNRRDDKPENTDGNCWSTTDEDKKLVFAFKKPCTVSKDKCSIIQFAVIGEENNSNTQSTCSDTNCRRTDELQFTVKYQGVRCNSAIPRFASAVNVILTCLAFYVLFMKKQL